MNTLVFERVKHQYRKVSGEVAGLMFEEYEIRRFRKIGYNVIIEGEETVLRISKD